MPPYLAAPHYHLSRLPVTTKWALTAFYVMVLSALAFAAAPLFGERTGFTKKGVEVNFAGTDHLQEKGEVVEREVAGKTTRQVYDIVHPHSFMMPVIFFILCHLMEMCYAPKGAKIALYLGAGAATLFVTFGPLLIHASLRFAVVMIPAVVMLVITYATMVLVPAIQMWRGVSPRTA